MPQLDLTIMTLYFFLTFILLTISYFIYIIAFFRPTVYALKVVSKRYTQYFLFFNKLVSTPARLRSSNLYNKALKTLKKWI